MNARSASNKAAILCRTIVDECPYVLIITETWHEQSNSTLLKCVTQQGYQCINAARPIHPDTDVHSVDFQSHGGLAVVYCRTIACQKKTLDVDVATFEYLFCHATTANHHFVLLGVYRPGSQVMTLAFFDELSAVFECIATYRCPVVVCGDFNVHIDRNDDPHAVRLVQLLQSFDCVQHVAEPTHVAGHMLDLVITTTDTVIADLCVGGIISDHALINFKLCMKKKIKTVRKVSRRTWQRLDHEAFAADLAASTLCCNLSTLSCISADDLVDMYNRVMTELLDSHCPSVTV